MFDFYPGLPHVYLYGSTSPSFFNSLPPFLSSLPPPLSAGNCSPRYMRATMYSAPCSKDLLSGCRVPMGLVIQPLADIPPQEVRSIPVVQQCISNGTVKHLGGMPTNLSPPFIPSLSFLFSSFPLPSPPNLQNTLRLVDHGPGGPIRCNRCKAYMNPFARFIDGGRQYLCPVCECSNEGEGCVRDGDVWGWGRGGRVNTHVYFVCINDKASLSYARTTEVKLFVSVISPLHSPLLPLLPLLPLYLPQWQCPSVTHTVSLSR